LVGIVAIVQDHLVEARLAVAFEQFDSGDQRGAGEWLLSH
jgi:hypothetical protein